DDWKLRENNLSISLVFAFHSRLEIVGLEPYGFDHPVCHLLRSFDFGKVLLKAKNIRVGLFQQVQYGWLDILIAALLYGLEEVCVESHHAYTAVHSAHRMFLVAQSYMLRQ